MDRPKAIRRIGNHLDSTDRPRPDSTGVAKPLGRYSNVTRWNNRLRSCADLHHAYARDESPMSSRASKKRLCWCGSGKRFMHCHVGREQAPRPTPGEVIDATSRIHGRKLCLYPDEPLSRCHGGIVKAHSIQRALLEKIAHKGHLIRWNHHLASLLKHNGQLRPDKIGLNDASTFTGLCSFHDNSVFAPVEKSPIRPGNDHALLLAYRALTREVFAKQNQLSLSEYHKTLDRGVSVPHQVALQQFLAAYQPSVALGLRDLLYHKSFYDSAILSSNVGSVRSYWFTLDRQPEFACTGCIFPEMDFQGRTLQDLADEARNLDLIACSVLPGDVQGHVIFSWLHPAPASSALVESLLNLPVAEIPHAITRFVFEFYENIFISPPWWDNLGNSDKQMLLARVTTATDSQHPRLPTCLADDGQTIVKWSIAQQHDFR